MNDAPIYACLVEPGDVVRFGPALDRAAFLVHAVAQADDHVIITVGAPFDDPHPRWELAGTFVWLVQSRTK